MTDSHLPSPAEEACLCRAYSSTTQKGGTLIAEDVHDLATHEQRLANPDSYRPVCCQRCGAKVHIHDLRPRVLRSEPGVATEIVRFRCADRAHCGAAWRVLPGFLARWLWGSWARVASVLGDGEVLPIPQRTRQRWHQRLAGGAQMLVGVLGSSSETGVWMALARAVGLDAQRIEVLEGYAAVRERSSTTTFSRGCIGELAGAVHRLCPGVRLM